MAQKLVFYATSGGVDEKIIEYTFHPGFSFSQVQKNILAIHCAIQKNSNPLEVSSKGMQAVSSKYSAFNLKVDGYPLEVVFQGAKVFEDENGNEFGPFFDEISKLSSKESKAFISKFSAENGYHLKKFSYQGKDWSLYPKTLFYDWMYYRAFTQNGSVEDIKEYNAFTDICFNFNKSVNCQARSLALIRVLIENSEYSKNIAEKEFYEIHRKYIK